jgi:hypothetical protein
MKSAKRTEYLTRENVMRLLSDAEVALVSTAETAPRLSNGDEYLDLEHLDVGVRRAFGLTPRTGRLLPRKAVHKDTWSKIVGQLPAASHTSASSRPLGPIGPSRFQGTTVTTRRPNRES